MEAELPPPTYKNPITKLENAIRKLEVLIAEDIEDEDDLGTLESMVLGMRRKYGIMFRERDAKIKDAWKPYWAIWGIKNAQESCQWFERIC
jgi:hypothetical protein